MDFSVKYLVSDALSERHQFHPVAWHYANLKSEAKVWHHYLFDHLPPGTKANALDFPWDEWRGMIDERDEEERKRKAKEAKQLAG